MKMCLDDIIKQVNAMNPGSKTALVVPDSFEQKILIDSIGELAHTFASRSDNAVTFFPGNQSLTVVSSECPDCPHLFDVAWISPAADITQSVAKVEIYLED
jgi:hypothetical protein